MRFLLLNWQGCRGQRVFLHSSEALIPTKRRGQSYQRSPSGPDIRRFAPAARRRVLPGFEELLRAKCSQPEPRQVPTCIIHVLVRPKCQHVSSFRELGFVDVSIQLLRFLHANSKSGLGIFECKLSIPNGRF